MGFPDEFFLQFKVNFKNLKTLPKGYQESGDIKHNALLDDIIIPIESGVQQGSSKSGMLFVFLLAPLLVLLTNDNTLTPIQLTAPNDRKISLNNIMGYSDDLTIDGEFQIENDDTCPQIENINKILDRFASFS